jgi:hypothetical protein
LKRKKKNFYAYSILFRFDFSKRGQLKKKDRSDVRIESEIDGNVDAIFMWWDLEMDLDGEIILSCAPRWAHPLAENLSVSQVVLYVSSVLTVCLHSASQGSHRASTFALF